jgi:hypothetical protein
MGEPLCPFCGAYSTRQCELEEEMPGCSCPWEDQLADEREREEEDRMRPDGGWLKPGTTARITVSVGYASPSASLAFVKGKPTHA